MAYCNLPDLKNYIGADEIADDPLLESLIARAQAWINLDTRRLFEAAADTTHYFTVGEDTLGRMLYLDGDLCQITSITTYRDNGSNGVVIPSTEYVTVPRNRTPWHAIDLRTNSAYYWRYAADPVDAIAVVGRWAYSVMAPADIAHATVRLAAFLYRQKDASIFDTIAQPELGVITVPQGMPKDVKLILAGYQRPAL